MSKTYQDTFTRTAGALAGSTSSDGLFTYAVDFDPNTNGTAIAATIAFSAVVSANCDGDDMYAEVDYTHTNAGVAIWLDVGSNGTYPNGTGYEFAMFGGNALIFAVAGGAFTQLATAAHTIATGTYRAERNGSALALYRNAGLIVSVTNSSEPTGVGKRRAVLGADGSGGNLVTYTEFRYGDIGGGGGGVGTEGWPKVRQSMRPARFKPMGDGFRTNKYRGWR